MSYRTLPLDRNCSVMDAFTLLFANLFYDQEATIAIYIWSGFAILNNAKTGLPDIFQDTF